MNQTPHDRASSMFARIRDFLTKGHSSLTEIGDRRRARLLAGVTLVLLLFFAWAMLSNPSSLSTFIALAVTTFISYILSRTPYYRIGNYFITYSITSLVYLSLYFGTTSSFNNAIATTAHVAIVLASILLSLRDFSILAAISIIATFTAPFYSKNPIPIDGSYFRDAGVYTVIALILAGATAFRNRIEQDRLIQFTEANTELENIRTNLENRVNERTLQLQQASQQTSLRANQLQAITELSEAIAQLKDLNELFPAATKLISERFGFYHVGIFLVDRSLSRPQGVKGQTTTIDYSRLEVTPGIRITNAALTFNLRSSQGGQHPVVLPENSRLQDVKINNAPLPLRLRDRTLMLPVKPGAQQYAVTWQEPRGISGRYNTSLVDIGANNVNSNITLNVPRDRVVLFVGGPAMGPAVLFWGVLIVFLLACIALAQFKTITPLRYWQWALLSIGLVPISVASAVVVIAWFFITGFRCRLAHDVEKWQFNLYQLSLVGFTLITAGTLVYAVSQGLLGIPKMQIFGNGSSQFVLNWYQDMNQQLLPRSWMLTIPMLAYRILMLLWALWLAFSVIRWSRWFWNCFTTHGYWRSVDWRRKTRESASDTALTAAPVGNQQTSAGTALQRKHPDDPSR